MKQFYAGLCSGTVTGFSSRKWAIKAGGALTRLVPVRAAHPQQYPSELFHDDIFLLIYGMPTAQAGAMVEERAINTEGCNQVNKRQAVSDYEHLGADRELLGSALYVKVVRACVADSKPEFQAAWNRANSSPESWPLALSLCMFVHSAVVCSFGCLDPRFRRVGVLQPRLTVLQQIEQLV